MKVDEHLFDVYVRILVCIYINKLKENSTPNSPKQYKIKWVNWVRKVNFSLTRPLLNDDDHDKHFLSIYINIYPI